MPAIIQAGDGYAIDVAPAAMNGAVLSMSAPNLGTIRMVLPPADAAAVACALLNAQLGGEYWEHFYLAHSKRREATQL